MFCVKSQRSVFVFHALSRDSCTNAAWSGPVNTLGREGGEGGGRSLPGGAPLAPNLFSPPPPHTGRSEQLPASVSLGVRRHSTSLPLELLFLRRKLSSGWRTPWALQPWLLPPEHSVAAQAGSTGAGKGPLPLHHVQRAPGPPPQSVDFAPAAPCLSPCLAFSLPPSLSVSLPLAPLPPLLEPTLWGSGPYCAQAVPPQCHDLVCPGLALYATCPSPRP